MNIIQSRNGHLPDHGKLRGNYTGERLKSLRPETYRQVVRLLAEPREHVSIREICRRCHVTDDTVKGIERREAVPIASRKQELMLQAARIAKLAADRVEDQIDTAPLPQAVVTFGVMTDKVQLLSQDPIQLQVQHTVEPGQRLIDQINELRLAIEANAIKRAEVVESAETQTPAAAQLPTGKTDAIEQSAQARPALPESSNGS